MNLAHVIVWAFLVLAASFMLFWFLPERIQDRISEIFCRLFAAERGDK